MVAARTGVPDPTLCLGAAGLGREPLSAVATLRFARHPSRFRAFCPVPSVTHAAPGWLPTGSPPPLTVVISMHFLVFSQSFSVPPSAVKGHRQTLN